MKTRAKIQKSIEIEAPRERIWSVLTGKETFSDWCSAFCPGSYFEGDWSVGSVMRFLGPSSDGNVNGMLIQVKEHSPGESIRTECVGVIENGQEAKSGSDYDDWKDTVEEYRLSGGPESFTLSISNDVPDSCIEYFNGAWDKALGRIKQLAEV